MAGGWLSGLCYFTLIVVTLLDGLRYVFGRYAMAADLLAVYAVYLGIVAESVIIDSDHWRHYFLILGLLWGLIAVSRPYLVAARTGMPVPEPVRA